MSASYKLPPVPATERHTGEPDLDTLDYPTFGPTRAAPGVQTAPPPPVPKETVTATPAPSAEHLSAPQERKPAPKESTQERPPALPPPEHNEPLNPFGVALVLALVALVTALTRKR